MPANAVVRSLLVFCCQAAIRETIAGEAPMPGDPGAFENRERETGKRAHVDLVWSLSGG